MRKKVCKMKALIVFGLIGLSACTTLGPEYEKPDVQWVENWHPDLYGQLTPSTEQSETDLRFWWYVFDDPTLNDLIEQTKQHNIDLRIAGLRILESRAQLGIATSTLYPQVQQLEASVLAAETRRRGGDLPNDNQSLVSYQSGFSLGWELDFWGKFKRSIESADAAFFNSIANHQNMQVLLSAQVTGLYFTYRTFEKRIEIAKHNVEIQKRSYDITKTSYEQGQESELDLQQAKTQYLGTLSTIPKLEVSLFQTRNALATLLARPPGVIPELMSDANKLPSINKFVLQDIPADLLMRRPDIRAAVWLVAAQSAQIGIAEADFYPSISLLGSMSWTGNDLGSTPDNGFLGAGPGITWNLFDHGRIENNVRVQDARLQQLIEQYQNTVLSAAREIDDAAISVVKTLEQMAIFEESVAASERALSLANTRYREGYSGFQRVLDAQRAMFTQAEQELVNKGNHINAIVNLYKALGGGWVGTPLDQLLPNETRNTMETRTDWGQLLTTDIPVKAEPALIKTGAKMNE